MLNISALLKELADTDLRLLRVRVERREASSEVDDLKVLVKGLVAEVSRLEAVVAAHQAKYRSAEKGLRDDRDKISRRRGEVVNFSNYKVQQSAEREIATAEAALTKKEDALLEILEASEQDEKQVVSLRARIKEASAKHDTLAMGLVEALEALEDREGRLKLRRQEILASLDEETVQTYERARERYPSDPLALIKGQACGNCAMSVRPQLLLEIRFNGKVTRCTGCSRVLIAATETENE